MQEFEEDERGGAPYHIVCDYIVQNRIIHVHVLSVMVGHPYSLVQF